MGVTLSSSGPLWPSHGLLRHVMRNTQDITLKSKQRLATLINLLGADHIIRYQDDIDYQQ